MDRTFPRRKILTTVKHHASARSTWRAALVGGQESKLEGGEFCRASAYPQDGPTIICESAQSEVPKYHDEICKWSLDIYNEVLSDKADRVSFQIAPRGRDSKGLNALFGSF